MFLQLIAVHVNVPAIMIEHAACFISFFMLFFILLLLYLFYFIFCFFRIRKCGKDVKS